jgi:5'-nucleotidase
MNEKKPDILIVNDDGIDAPGIRALIGVMKELGNVLVVAPDGPQSGMGHAITIAKPLRLDKVDLYPGVEMYKSSGTPVDCVKLAVNQIFKGRKPDLCVSGINHGLNQSISVIYSGTMSAAVEGAIESIPSIGFSYDDFTYDADFAKCLPYVKTIAKQVLEHGLPAGTLLNVNIPNSPSLKGIKICRQANAKYAEEFDERTDPHKRNYYWLTGVFQLNDHGEDTDVWALNNHYVSVVPTQFDMTAHHAIPLLNSWNFDAKEK